MAQNKWFRANDFKAKQKWKPNNQPNCLNNISQPKLLFFNQQVPFNLQGFWNKFIIYPNHKTYSAHNQTHRIILQSRSFVLLNGMYLIVLSQFITHNFLTPLPHQMIISRVVCSWNFIPWGSNTHTEIRLDTIIDTTAEYWQPEYVTLSHNTPTLI